jgi:hypothetical protein
MRYPILASRGCEAEHGLLYAVLGEFGFSFSDRIDDALMCIDIMPPSASTTTPVKSPGRSSSKTMRPMHGSSSFR